jgi:hypothetical protein
LYLRRQAKEEHKMSASEKEQTAESGERNEEVTAGASGHYLHRERERERETKYATKGKK